jgi:hypothetical protein
MLYLSVLRSLARSTLVDPHFAGVALPAQSHLPSPVWGASANVEEAHFRRFQCRCTHIK